MDRTPAVRREAVRNARAAGRGAGVAAPQPVGAMKATGGVIRLRRLTAPACGTGAVCWGQPVCSAAHAVCEQGLQADDADYRIGP